MTKKQSTFPKLYDHSEPFTAVRNSHVVELGIVRADTGHILFALGRLRSKCFFRVHYTCFFRVREFMDKFVLLAVVSSLHMFITGAVGNLCLDRPPVFLALGVWHLRSQHALLDLRVVCSVRAGARVETSHVLSIAQVVDSFRFASKSEEQEE